MILFYIHPYEIHNICEGLFFGSVELLNDILSMAKYMFVLFVFVSYIIFKSFFVKLNYCEMIWFFVLFIFSLTLVLITDPNLDLFIFTLTFICLYMINNISGL